MKRCHSDVDRSCTMANAPTLLLQILGLSPPRKCAYRTVS